MKNNINAVLRIARQLNYILMPEHKRRLVPLFFVLIFSAVFELVGVTVILPFVQAVMTPDVVMESRYFKPIFDAFGVTDSRGVLITLGILIILLYVIKNLFLIFSNYYQQDYATRVQKDLSLKLLGSFMKRPYIYYTDTSSAIIGRGCGSDVSGVYTTVVNILGIITEVFTSLAIGGFIILAEPFIAIGVIGILLLTMLVIIYFFKPIIKRLSIKNRDAGTRVNKAMFQIVQGVKELYVMDRKELFIEDYDDASDVVRKTSRNYAFMSATPDRIVEAICIGGMLGIVILRLISMSDLTSFIPKLAAFAMAAFKLMPAVGKITSRINMVVYGQVFVQETYDNLQAAAEYEAEVAEYNRLHVLDGMLDNEDENRHFENILEVKNVRWKYTAAPTEVLSDVSFSVKKGESIALIGPSGAGKTTMSDIILGLYRPQAGGVYMDGIDVYTMPHTWARIVGYVQQSVFIADTNVRDNITFGMKGVSDEEVWNALDRAYIGDFVRTLPNGLNNKVGERGVKFSGGQKQRLAIARALLNKPEILVLDEATSALDNETEKAIMESIDALQGEVTLIIIAHRLTTIKNCDHIFEIRDGIATECDKKEVLSRA